MPYPDNFNPHAFDRAQGTNDVEPDIGRDVETAAKLVNILTTASNALACLHFETVFPAPGYGMEDITGMLDDVRSKIDLREYLVRAEAVAIEREMGA